VRNAGVLGRRPGDLAVHDHVAWCGDGAAGFARSAADAFAAAADRERLVLVGDLARLEWDPATLFAEPLRAGRLELVDSAAAYRPVLDGGADFAGEQLGAFRTVLDRALADGWSGVRVAADNTPALTAGPAVEERWLAWEQLTDRWQAGVPVTGVCYFDRTAVPAERLARVAGLHPLSWGLESPLRIYHDTAPDGRSLLVLDGAVEASDEAELRLRLLREVVDAGRPAEGSPVLTVDLSRTTYVHHRGLQALQDVATATGAGVVELRGAPTIVRRLVALLPDLTRLRLT
jgi:hypothetical protein